MNVSHPSNDRDLLSTPTQTFITTLSANKINMLWTTKGMDGGGESWNKQSSN